MTTEDPSDTPPFTQADSDRALNDFLSSARGGGCMVVFLLIIIASALWQVLT